MKDTLFARDFGIETPMMFLEPLEARIAPAALAADGKTVTFTDADGDEVTVKFNQKVPQGTDIGSVVKFDTPFANGGNQTLQTIDLTAWNFQPGKSEKFSVEVTTKQAGGGDGKTNVGQVVATGVDVSTIKISGDLAKITVGDNTNQVLAIKNLEVGSLGAGGVAAFGGTAGVDNLDSSIGGIGKLKTTGDVENANVSISTGAGKIEIGGAIKGGSDANTGRLTVSGNADNVNVKGGIEGGGGNDSGVLTVNGNVGVLDIGGDVKGGSGQKSGGVKVGGNVGAYNQGGDLQGGSGADSGFTEINGALKKGKVAGSISGGTGGDQAGVFKVGSFGTISIGSIFGGDMPDSGQFIAVNGGGKAVIAEGITGGGGENSGIFQTLNAPVSSFLTTDIIGGAGNFSGGVFIAAGDVNGDGKDDVIAKAGIAKLQGAGAEGSGFFEIDAPVKSFSAGAVMGGGGMESGLALLDGGAGKLAFGEGITGGSGDFSGGVRVAMGDLNGDGIPEEIAAVIPTIQGGGGEGSGVFESDAPFKSYKGEFLLGGGGDGSGAAIFHSYARKVSLSLDIRSTGGGMNAGVIDIAGNCDLLNIAGAVGGTATVGGSLQVFANKFGAFVGSEGFSLNVGGVLEKASFGGPANGLVVSAGGGIDSFLVKGNASGMDIFSGYADPSTPVNGNAVLGTVKVGGSAVDVRIWSGVADINADGVPDIVIGGGTAAEILNVVIGRGASDTSIVSAHVVQASIDGEKIALSGGPGNDDLTVGTNHFLELSN